MNLQIDEKDANVSLDTCLMYIIYFIIGLVIIVSIASIC